MTPQRKGNGMRRSGRITRKALVGVVATALVMSSSAVTATAGPAAVGRHLLGTLGGSWSYPNDLNNAGQVVGHSQATDGRGHAFRWQRGVLTDLGKPGETSTANAVNERGVVVGTSENRAVMWRNGSMSILVEATEAGPAMAYGVNDRDEVIGVRYLPTSYMYGQGFVWRNGRFVDLPGLGGDSYPVQINNRGDIVGFVEYDDGASTDAALWRNGLLTVIQPPGAVVSMAHAVNDRGQVLGSMKTITDSWHHFLWDNGVLTDLGDLNTVGINNRGEVAANPDREPGALPVRWHRGTQTALAPLGGGSARASAINSAGAVAGESSTTGGQRHGVVWLRGGRTIDLGPLRFGTSTASVWAMNDRGLVVGVVDPDGAGTQGVVWKTAKG
ncbi:hypothetical protein E0H26_28410 [Micromonospora zingiberis]|uniref:HAF repeat-containing protein n=1 Tax=Micromonospora zingiberis TaxID=2053011 RepID=A0A4V2LUG7_9ACTN|nr:hypothetical protein [Micromonospora zingiberis]TCB88645.1 hypothetical protein E0H26_28410 [Micromonospora zingiberis]